MLGLHDVAELPKHSLIHFRAQGAAAAPVHWASWQKFANVPELDVRAGLVFSTRPTPSQPPSAPKAWL